MAKTEHLDTMGLLCPLPVLRIIKRMRELKPGDQLVIKADDPAASIDIPHYCHEHGHLLVETESVAGQTIFKIEKK